VGRRGKQPIGNVQFSIEKAPSIRSRHRSVVATGAHSRSRRISKRTVFEFVIGAAGRAPVKFEVFWLWERVYRATQITSFLCDVGIVRNFRFRLDWGVDTSGDQGGQDHGEDADRGQGASFMEFLFSLGCHKETGTRAG